MSLVTVTIDNRQVQVEAGTTILEAAKRHKVPIFKSIQATVVIGHATTAYLDRKLAPKITRHGVLLDVYGVGVMLMGESGLGKSEAALEMIKRGHRLVADDVVESELLAVAGSACPLLDGRDASFTFNGDLVGVLTDGVDANDMPFRNSFPYLARAQSGQSHWHTNPYFNVLLPWAFKDFKME